MTIIAPMKLNMKIQTPRPTNQYKSQQSPMNKNIIDEKHMLEILSIKPL
jgi:hypothetical protein